MKRRKEDIDRFYQLLKSLESKSEKRTLEKSNGKSGWPGQGIYFFFEENELRENGAPRVVRIGTHAVSEGSKTKYWTRLRQHKGTEKGYGNHRGSVFRKLIGQSIIGKENLDQFPFWGKKIDRKHKDSELELEKMVSNYIRKMSFLSLTVPGESIKDNDRAYIETNSIALISNINKEPIDKPSISWIGYHSNHRDVIASGIWNSDDTDKDYDPNFLDKLEELIIKQ